MELPSQDVPGSGLLGRRRPPGQSLDRGLSRWPLTLLCCTFVARPGDCAAPAAEPPLAPSSHSSSTDDFCYMFAVELERGPSGLGMGLIDGMVSDPPCRFLQAPRLLLFPRDGPTAGVVTGRRRAEAHGPGDQGLVGASPGICGKGKGLSSSCFHRLHPQASGRLSWACGDSDGVQRCA